MNNAHNLSPLALLGLALLLGVAACKPSTPTATDAIAPSMDSPKASAAERVTAAVDALHPMPIPRDVVMASMRKMTDARSYHADMHIDGSKIGARDSAMDFVAPDRYRIAMAGMGTQLIIGDTMYLDMHGRTLKSPAPAGQMRQWRDPANFDEIAATMTVEDQGRDPVNGTPAHKYLVHNSQPTPVDMTLWINDDGLPLQLATRVAIGNVTTRYSRFNDPALSIEVPQ